MARSILIPPATAVIRAFATLAVLLYAVAGHPAGTPGASGPDPVEDGSSAQAVAEEHYEAGIAFKESAWALQSEASAATTDAQRETLLAAAGEAYQGAIHAQGKALKYQPTYYQAANELGYALRSSGDYRKALGAYNYALGIKPDFYPAVEYRGEAYLALGMLEKAQSAYMVLFRADPTLAAQLLLAMDQWAQDQDDEAFSAWVAERKQLAALTPFNQPGEAAGHATGQSDRGWEHPPSE